MSTQPQGSDAAPSPGASAPGGGAAPSAAPANPQQVMLAQMYQVMKRLSMESPQLAAPLQKAMQGLQEAQTAMLTNKPGPSPEQNPPV